MTAGATRRDDWTPLIVAVAPTGAYRSKADHPALPETAAEIAATAAACREQGAAMIHLHVRDREGRHTVDADAYRRATDAIRGAVGDDLIIQVTSESGGRFGPDAQMAMVRELRPEAVSLAVRELVPDATREAAAAAFLAWLERERILPQFILYTVEDVARYRDLRARGVVPGGGFFTLFVLGRYGVAEHSSPRDLMPFVAAWSDDPAPWAACAFGRRECACAMTAAALGGHVRVGFENNLLLSDGRPAPDNAALVAQARIGAEVIGRVLADGATARNILWQAIG